MITDRYPMKDTHSTLRTLCRLSGYHPFDEYGDLSEPELLEKIIACDYNFDDPVWEEISDARKKRVMPPLERV